LTISNEDQPVFTDERTLIFRSIVSDSTPAVCLKDAFAHILFIARRCNGIEDQKGQRGRQTANDLLPTRARAYQYAEELIGTAPQRRRRSPIPASKPISSYEQKATECALRLLSEGMPIGDTPAAAFLNWRGVLEPALEVGEEALRFHPDCPFGEGTRHPCMLALMRDISSNDPRAVQRTALTQALMRAVSRTTFAEFKEAGGRVTRMTLGPTTGTAIKLSRDEDVTEGLAIGEGTESVLAAMRLGFRPAWALGGTSGVKSFPILSGIEALTILVDNDANGAGQAAAQQCSERWIDAGREVFRAVPNHTGDDFNDVLRWSRA
jgi:putative DNA primase/helicase